MPKIKKCICGGSPIVKHIGDKPLYVVKCSKCGLVLAKPYEASNLESGAIGIWNKRIEDVNP